MKTIHKENMRTIIYNLESIYRISKEAGGTPYLEKYLKQQIRGLKKILKAMEIN